MAARLAGVPVVCTRHSVFDPPGWATSFPMKQVLGLTNNALSDRIIAVSPAARQNLTDTGADPSKITVVYNGVSPVPRLPEWERARLREEFGAGERDFVCAIIARLEDVKGHRVILDAAKLLLGTNVRIYIAGTGSLESGLRAAAEAEGLRNVSFTGFLTDVYKLENIMDLQLNASWGTEATSLALLEGMSIGVPAVVSDFGGNPFVIQCWENGVVVPKKDPAALASVILRLSRDEALMRQLSSRAVQIFHERFTVEAMTRSIEGVYREILAGK
jgi:glycosyltransferase involved in cell wall biosynthesis